MYYFFLKYKVFPTFVIIFLGYFMKKITSLSIILLVSLYSFSLPAQDKNGLEKNADMLHKTYRFNEALLIYRQLLENTTDSLARINLENKIIFSENGKNLLEFASEPRVIEKKNFGKNTFFLHYPGFPDGSWVEMPRGLAPQMPENEKAVIYCDIEGYHEWERQRLLEPLYVPFSGQYLERTAAAQREHHLRGK